MSFEDQLQEGMFKETKEKTFIDKLLAKEDVQSIRQIIKKDRLNRSDMLEALYMLSSNESKLLNFSEWDRYVILKFFVWIREFIKVAELSFDYHDDLELKQKLCECGGYKDLSKAQEHLKECECKVTKYTFVITTRTKRLLENQQRLIEHNVKFLIDLYFAIGRTSLSLGGTGFLEILKNKYEINYTQPPPPQQPEQKKGFLSLRS